MVTVDGYFEGEGHDISWHNANNQEFTDFVGQQNQTIGTILMGHRTFDMMASFWPTEEAKKIDAATSEFMTNTQKIAVSHEPFGTSWENTRIISDNVYEEIQKLKEEDGKDIAIFGSNMLCVSLVEHGLVDEFRIMVNPVALGKGNPLFTGLSRKINLKLVDVIKFESGNVLLKYFPI